MPSESGAAPGDTSGSAVGTSVPVPGAGSPRAWLCFIEWKGRTPRDVTEGRTGLINHRRKEDFSPWKGVNEDGSGCSAVVLAVGSRWD